MNDRLKDKIRFFAGLGMLTYETVWEQADRPWLIIAGLGLVGYSQVANLEKFLKK